MFRIRPSLAATAVLALAPIFISGCVALGELDGRQGMMIAGPSLAAAALAALLGILDKNRERREKSFLVTAFFLAVGLLTLA